MYPIDMSGIDYYKPVMAMIGMQLTYAGVALSTRAALLQGMSPSVFVFYRQGIATLVIAPIAYFARWVFEIFSHMHVLAGRILRLDVFCDALGS